jgi:diaminopimelate decarboxylase
MEGWFRYYIEYLLKCDYPLTPGDRIISGDMIHSATVKTTMFNGVPHPATVKTA